METETKMSSQCHLLEKLALPRLSRSIPTRERPPIMMAPEFTRARRKEPICKINNLDYDFIHLKMIIKECLGK